ncbi:bifunctional aminoglycoside phosphotransferase/ATP-binding protein [Ramlibacter montanisoli]|uniref:bifunctional aminoglycoside phosphotransferase/ATP-binding protein n=1 Tax=Ramlibacter montanisoli TaxID=2732512 RepID=UPI002814FC73|nr:AAA family ATPase [Ramlibacter montanisoli]
MTPLWQARRAAGHTRECHGDLHLANILELDGAIAAFDCIEFDDALRCIDVVEDVAFTQMDLAARATPALASRFLNAWLEHTGEYEGVAGLRLCLAYRALVRAMVENLRTRRSEAALAYAGQALAWRRRAAPRLVITHGLPGSGKTFASQRLLEHEGAIRIRSDVERSGSSAWRRWLPRADRASRSTRPMRPAGPTSACSRWPASPCGRAGPSSWTLLS